MDWVLDDAEVQSQRQQCEENVRECPPGRARFQSKQPTMGNLEKYKVFVFP